MPGHREIATQASRRMISRGERPLYRPRLEAAGEVVVVRIPELELVTEAPSRSGVAAASREAIATWLDVSPDSFDIEVERPV